MKTPSRKLLLIVSATVSVLAVPGGLLAQRQSRANEARTTEARADALDAQARRYETSDWSKLGKAVSLRREAASLRGVDDPKSAESLYWAAQNSYGIFRLRTARALMEQAGDRYAMHGDVLNAAKAYTDAAYLSMDLHERAHTVALVLRAKRLTHSPMLSQQQRVQLLARLESKPSPGQVATARKAP